MPDYNSGHPDALGPVTEGVPKKIRTSRLSKPGVVEFAAPPKPEFSFNLKPADIAKHLNRFVIGQREAKKVLSVALCDHFQHVRLTLEGNAAPFYQKQNVLLLGPTGVGKTHLIRSAAELISVPFVKADATKFSETGYVGGDVDDLVRDLLRRAVLPEDFVARRAVADHVRPVHQDVASQRDLGLRRGAAGEKQDGEKREAFQRKGAKTPGRRTYLMICTHDASNFKVFKTASRSNSGGFLILMARRFSGTSSIIVNCEPCGCHVNRWISVLSEWTS